MIEVNELVKQYGDFVAVKGISFNAQPGQVTGFLGPNGAGKTTTLRMLTGFMPPTAGSAKVAGFDVFDQSMEVRKRVGYLPESVPLYRDMTAVQYLMYIGEIRGIKHRRERAYEVLRRVGLSHRGDSLIRTLSKGMRQRVGLAQALIHDPEVLILDEPTIGLDPIQVLELRDLISELRQKHTVLFSTHILSEAEQVCDKVVIIQQGAIIAQGTPTELRATLERGGRVLVRANAPVEDLSEALGTLPSVLHTEIVTEGLVVTPKTTDHDPRPEVARRIIERGWSLIELRPLAVNLEEIFLELTRAQKRAEVVEAPPSETQSETSEAEVQE
ncbi:MAG: ABC transporter ATP-binding protein [Anaerolineae bacterium]|jgi:ABC-2 type transport system ATP-binding protein|nr:ABC transporter ATP-binding protein [Anaerolineae bacterium]